MDHEIEMRLEYLEHATHKLAEALRSGHQPATKHDLKETEHRIMSAISDFAAKVNAFNDRIDTAITDLQGDVENLQKQIADLQASSGAITPEDQALLDAIQNRASTVADKLDALDALTPPVAPPEPPPVASPAKK